MAQKRSGHRAKNLKEISKKNTPDLSDPSPRDHFEVIRKDLVKLREDLQKGWTIARETFAKRPTLGLFRKNRQSM